MSSKKMKTADAAAYIGKSASWLNKARLTGVGPVYLKIGGGVLYDVDDLDVWLAGKRRTAVYDFANDNARSAARAA
ncbi:MULTISPECIES: helix-turn-helix domain-containing protein [unclassified Rhizobium]|uniref:helix-turn-helix domain-containing protein n=1 Tax=unclassified Rhizobium TaxID=2613769 RepID=UPI001179929F|nr:MULTISPECIES: helix-turn-helix domain-containing protein [unclassified Rhizobium]